MITYQVCSCMLHQPSNFSTWLANQDKSFLCLGFFPNQDDIELQYSSTLAQMACDEGLAVNILY